jgi:hypothetical protein
MLCPERRSAGELGFPFTTRKRSAAAHPLTGKDHGHQKQYRYCHWRWRRHRQNTGRDVCCGRREHLLNETKELIKQENAQALAISTDVTDRSQVRRMVDA